MAKYAICEKCKKLYEYNPEVITEGGITYTTSTCNICGHVKKSNSNFIHYGNDGK